MVLALLTLLAMFCSTNVLVFGGATESKENLCGVNRRDFGGDLFLAAAAVRVNLSLKGIKRGRAGAEGGSKLLKQRSQVRLVGLVRIDKAV